MTQLTDKQKETYKHVKTHYKKHGYPCTQSYLAELAGIGKQTMHVRVMYLVKAGYVRKTPDGQVMPVDK